MQKQAAPVVASFWNYESLDYLYRQGGGGGLFSPGEGVENWYDRLHSEELVQKAKDAGFNMIVTHFFKGFGLEHEEKEITMLRKLIAIAHQKDIKVLGYVQLYSLFTETFPYENPDLEKMCLRNPDGTPVTWGSRYYRYKTCYNSPEFIAYIQKVIRYGIEELGLDGFHFDNSNQERCYCENCTNAFRAYLKKHVPDPRPLLGIRGFDYVNIPRLNLTSVFGWPMEGSFSTKHRTREIHDPLYLLWTSFYTEVVKKAHDTLFGYAKEISGGKAIVLHNPGFPAGGEVYTDFGYKPHATSRFVDYAYAENVSFIHMEEGKLISQIPGYKINGHFGVQTFNTSWARDENGFARFPKDYAEIARWCAESMVFTGLIYCSWLVRFQQADTMTNLDQPLHQETFRKVTGYFHANKDLYEDTVEKNRVKLLYYPLDLIGNMDLGYNRLQDTVNALSLNGVPFSITTQEELEELTNGEVLIVPDGLFASQSLYDELKAAGERGVRILVLGHFGIYDENGRSRSEKNPVVNIGTLPFVTVLHSEEALAQQLRALSCCTSHREMIVELKQNKAEELLVHVLNPNNETPADRVTIQLPKEFCKNLPLAEIRSFEDTTLESYAPDTGILLLRNVKTLTTIRLSK